MIANFISKLYKTLKQNDNSNVFSWDDTGNMVCIKNTNEFSKYILPKLTGAKTLPSFIRQMNIYGFRKRQIAHGNIIYFENENFKRDKPYLIQYISRKPDAKLRRNSTLKRKRKEQETQIQSLFLLLENINTLIPRQDNTIENNKKILHNMELTNSKLNLLKTAFYRRPIINHNNLNNNSNNNRNQYSHSQSTASTRLNNLLAPLNLTAYNCPELNISADISESSSNGLNDNSNNTITTLLNSTFANTTVDNIEFQSQENIMSLPSMYIPQIQPTIKNPYEVIVPLSEQTLQADNNVITENITENDIISSCQAVADLQNSNGLSW